MRSGKSRTNLYILLIAIIVAVIAAYYLPDQRPHDAGPTAPKANTQAVEPKRAEPAAQQVDKTHPPAPTTAPLAPLTGH